jgi:iron complex outermembrane receptor protein/vitamin B12 transporter
MTFTFFSRARVAARLSASARRHGRAAFPSTLLAALLVVPAHAVIVRGHLRDAYGKPLGGGQVKLVVDGQAVAIAFAERDGSFELRCANSGRFTLLGLDRGYLPGIGEEFYGGANDILDKDVTLATNTVKQDVTVTATGLATPLPQLTAPATVIPGEALALQAGVVDALRQQPGAFLVQTGQAGSVSSLFMRGGDSTANLVLIDGMPAGDVGGVFDFGTVSSTAISRIDVLRGPDSAMYGTDAGAAVVSIETPRGTTAAPLITYSGDGGNLSTYRNEATLSGTINRFDYFGAFSRFDTANALPQDKFHDETEAINSGYNFNGNTSLRFTLRNNTAVQGLPGPWDFQGVSSEARQADQDLFLTGTLENRTKYDWHNLLRYGIARKREQAVEFANVGNYLSDDPGEFDSPGYVGNVVTIRGANGYAATGQVQLFSGNNYDQDSNRDQLYYQTDYSFSPHFSGLFGFRYDNERGSFNDYDPAYGYSEHEAIQRTNFEYNLQFQGEFFHRLFYSAGGAVEKNHLYGIAGTPRVGLSYVAVRPNGHGFHGTRLRANAATGVWEPTLSVEEASLYHYLLVNGDTADLATYHIGPPSDQRSRTYDFGVDQNIDGDKLLLKLGYFHNVFNHDLEGVTGPALVQYFGFNIPSLNSPYVEAYVNSLAYRAQGAEVELVWQPRPSFLVRGGYTYLDTRVVQSFATDAVAAVQGQPTENPNIPGVAIGALGPLVGARPFRRPPHTGYFNAQYLHKRFSGSLQGALASRSDDSTFLVGEDLNGGNTLLLPNRNLDFGYVKLDLGFTYQVRPSVVFFGQLDNLLNDQHIGPIGYPGLPFTFRTGLKLRLGGEK